LLCAVIFLGNKRSDVGNKRMIGALTPRRLGKRGWSVLSSCIIPSNCISVYPFKMHVNYFV